MTQPRRHLLVRVDHDAATFARRRVHYPHANPLLQFGNARHAVFEGVGMGLTHQRHPFVRAHDLLMLPDRARGEVTQYLLPCGAGGGRQMANEVTGGAIHGAYFDAVPSGLYHQALE